MKIDKERITVNYMIKKYCHGKHHTKGQNLCKECTELTEYVNLRLSKCPHGDNKPFCSNCKIHCYKSDMREKIKLVMKYSGPRMIFSHPIMATKHLIETKKEKRRIMKEEENSAR